MTSIVRVPAFCTQCRSRCGCTAVVEDGTLRGIEPLPSHPTGAQLCPKGRAAPELVYHPDRLTTPMRRRAPRGAAEPRFEPIGWDEALDETAWHLRRIAREHGPEQTAFSVTTQSGTHIVDAIAWVTRFINAYGSPNTINATEICNWHKDFASRFTYGHDIGIPDIPRADCIVLWGNNPSATWLARAAEINRARQGGTPLLVVDPRPTPFSRRASVWLQVRPGSDRVLALGLARALIELGGADLDFLTRWSNGPLLVRDDTGAFLTRADLGHAGDRRLLARSAQGLLAYDPDLGEWQAGTPELATRDVVDLCDGTRTAVRSAYQRYLDELAPWTPRRVEEHTGIAPEDLQAAARLLAERSRIAYYAWNGVGQSTDATQTDRALSLLYTLTGSYGRAGGNIPDPAAPFADISGGELMSGARGGRALGLPDRPIGPATRGWVLARDVYRAILEQTPYPVRMLVSFGTNLLVAHPDAGRGREALRRLEFHVHADFFENATARQADLLLPVATSWEREGLRAGFDATLAGARHVQLRPPVVAPVGSSRSDIDIVMALSHRLELGEAMFGLDVDRGHDHLLAPSGLTVAALRARPEGIHLDDHPVPEEPQALRDAHGRVAGLPTPTRRIEIYSEHLLRHGQAPLPTFDARPRRADPRFPLLLGCAKTLTYCHSQHRNLPSLRRRESDPPLAMHPEDAASRGLAAGDWVRITSPAGEAVARVVLAPQQAPGTVFAQHGWWLDGEPGAPNADGLAANINALIETEEADPVSGSVALRHQPCEVEAIATGRPAAS